MTKKDYILISSAINKAITDGKDYKVVGYITDALEADNPNFDRNKFLDACFA